MHRTVRGLSTVLVILLAGCSAPSTDRATATGSAGGTDWPTYGHDPGGMRYSPLAQITPQNVVQLQPMWTYHMRKVAPTAAPGAEQAIQAVAEGAAPAGPPGRLGGSEVTPLVVNGMMYLSTPYRQVVALDPDSGREIWAFDVPGPGQPSLRGVEYWAGDALTGPRILFGTRDGRLFALDARTGASVAGFGAAGVVNLKTPEIMRGSSSNYGMTSPPLIYKDLVITGAANQEFPDRGSSGAVRAWDVRSGKLVWTFDPVPQAGQLGSETWEPGSAERRSGANVWGFMTVDVARGIVYMPFGAPAWDRYGGDRKGANLFSTSLVAADAATGKYLWHFQVVHHDIWDNDLQAPPALFDVNKDGRRIPAVAIVSKNGLLFLLDRTNGNPIHAVEERAVPPSDVPGEQAWPTQPFPVKPAPLARTSFSMAEVASVTPELKAWCENWIRANNMKFGDLYLPVGFNTATINFPGLQGGANWGGGSFDPVRGYLFVNTLDMGQVTSLVSTAEGPLPIGRGPVSGRFMQPDTRLMCQQPPWGRMSAVDVSTGEIVWQSVLGISDNLPSDRQKTGRPNVGGSIATAGGLVFIGATDDARLRAFDSANGAEVWTIRLPASAHATPITYAGKSGKQFVVIAATGGSFLNSPIASDTINAFALP